MQHVDDALLVAYADDALDQAARADVEAHLVTCAACRARVEEERALTQRVAAVLDTTVPAGEPAMPAFADILRRSDASDATPSGGARSPRSRSWTMPPLAWAAMLVVGIGAAYIARTIIVSPEFNAPMEARTEQAADASAVRAAPEAAPAAGATPEDAPVLRAAPDAGASATRAAPGAADAATQDDAGAGLRFESVPVMPPSPAPQAARAAQEPAAAKAAEEPALRPEEAPRVEPSRERARYADMVRDTAVAAAAPGIPDTTQGLALDVVVTGAAPAGAAVIGGEDVAWRGTSVAAVAPQATRVAGLPGAPVTSVWLGADAAAWRARVVQQVGDVSVETIEWRRPPAAAGESGRLGDGRNYLFVTTDSVMYLLRAALPVERLETIGRMLQLLEP